MLSVTGYILLVLLSIFVYYQFFAKKSNKKLPPGTYTLYENNHSLHNSYGLICLAPPYKLPIVGHALKAGTRPYKTFKKWAETYGSIMSVQLGPTKLVINPKNRICFH